MTALPPPRDEGMEAFIYRAKVGALLMGGGLGLAGALTERPVLTWIGIGIVAIGIGLRFFGRNRRGDKQD